MIAVILALVPLLFATGFLTWTMTMGAREQARSDAWAKEWARKHHPKWVEELPEAERVTSDSD